MPRRQGLGGLTDADFWGVAWAMFAVTAGSGLMVAAIAFFRRSDDAQAQEFDVGYNLLATQLDR